MAALSSATEARLMIETTFLATSEKLCPGACKILGGPRNSPAINAMFDELRRFGFTEGQNLTIVWRQYTLHVDLISEFAAELVKSKVDVIYAAGDAAIRAVQRATTTIPILGGSYDMVEAGLVKSLARPEGNTTGTSFCRSPTPH